MKKLTVILFMVFTFQWLIGQNYQKVNISYLKVGDGLYDFYVENPNFYPVQLDLSFTEFVNMTATCPLPFIGNINPGKYKIFQVRRILIDIPGNFKYTHFTRIGAYPVVYDPATVYNLPVGKGKETKALTFDLSKSDDPNKILWGFSMQEGDTVFACREGIVCMKSETQLINGYLTGENSITILQPDNSFAKYESLADSQLFVNMGDTIYTGTALGLAGGSKWAVGAHVRFSVYYVNARIDSIEENKIRNYHQYINPLFKLENSVVSTLGGNKIYRMY